MNFNFSRRSLGYFWRKKSQVVSLHLDNYSWELVKQPSKPIDRHAVQLCEKQDKIQVHNYSRSFSYHTELAERLVQVLRSRDKPYFKS